jgi:hypothetical protein
VDISGASIPAVSSVIISIMPVRCDRGKVAIRSEVPIPAVKSLIKGT